MLEILDGLQTKILIAQFYRCDLTWNFQNVRSPFSRLYWISGGAGEVRHQGQSYKLRPGSMFIIPCYTPSDYRCAQQMDHYYVHFRCLLPFGLDLFTILKPPYAVKPPRRAEIHALFERLVELKVDTNVGAHFEAHGLLRELLSHFLNRIAPVDLSLQLQAHHCFDKVLLFIEKHLAERIGLADLAREACLSETYFSNRFSTLFGCSPMRYLNNRRVERAQDLLWSTTSSVEEIARQVGFEDNFYFSRVFKKFTGRSPSEYRTHRLYAD